MYREIQTDKEVASAMEFIKTTAKSQFAKSQFSLEHRIDFLQRK
jgi:hypothetical protein